MSGEEDRPVPNAHSDHGPMEFLDQDHLIPVSGEATPDDESKGISLNAAAQLVCHVFCATIY